jgi:hypothetical protein
MESFTNALSLINEAGSLYVTQTCNPPVSASQVLGIQVYATTPGYKWLF